MKKMILLTFILLSFCFKAESAITIHSESHNTGVGTDNAIVIPAPASISNNDYLVAIIGVNDESLTLQAATGWTRADIDDSSFGSDRQLAIFYKKVTDYTSESTYKFTVGSADAVAWWIGALSGVDQTNPEDEPMDGNAGTTSDDSSPGAPSITTVTANSFGLAAWMSTETTPDTDTTMPVGWEVRVEDATVALGIFSVVSKTHVTAGVQPSVEITDLGGLHETSCGQWAFRPGSTSRRIIMVQ